MKSYANGFQTGLVHIVTDDSDLEHQVNQLIRPVGYETRWTRTGSAMLAELDPSQAGCLLIDSPLPDMSGLELFARVRQAHRHAQAVLVSSSWYLNDVVHAMRIGAVEVLEKSSDGTRLRDALLEALRLDSEKRESKRRSVPVSILGKLTADEARLFQLFLQGMTAKQVSAEMDLSVRTVHYRKKELLKKLGVSSRNEAIELCRSETADSVPM